MSFLNKLKAEKLAADKYAKEAEDLKQAIFKINLIYSEKDGEFLEDLKEFLKKWEN